jgi:tRNA nucleotidyltransferase (CCA-adding enzyme)
MAKGIYKKDLTIITTHTNADFDAVASMLAAQKFYPDALVVFPGSQEKNLRNFFVQSMAYLFNMADIKNIDFERVTKLVLVDTRQPKRIGKLLKLLDKPDLTIDIYDHHPPAEGDIKGHFECHRLTGATVTILADRIRDEKINITADEATIMCLGIYEDTGSFTFPSTTEADFHAAAFLLSKGANLNVVSNLIAREIDQHQLTLLNDMFQAATRHNINGIEVMVTTVSCDRYVPDLAFLVHKMVKMENINAIFAVARMENKVYVIARSRVPEVDASEVVKSLGGGGHQFAAAAAIKGQTLAQTEQKLLDTLYAKIKSRRRAKDLMSAPAITIRASVSCREARKLLTRYNVNALIVVAENIETGQPALQGYITRQVIEKVLYHRLGHVPIKEYMNTETATVGPDSDLHEIQETIITNKQRIIPVVDKDQIVGVLTRTDLLNLLIRDSRHLNSRETGLTPDTLHARKRNVVKFLKERLSKQLITTLKNIGETADELGNGAYVVGGFVRDLFLYRPNEDVDIVIEGDGIAFAQHFAKHYGARIHTHAKFGTAVIIFDDGFKIDVASARLEYYQFPAALPIVEMSSIKLDLFRRDFTINTLAIQLNSNKFGTLIDFFSAHRDIKEKVIRVLHNLSLVEDPTRIFRAIRFEQRFGFNIGKLTAGLIANAVKMDFFKRLSGKRMFTELRQLLEEENPAPAIIRLGECNLLNVIHSAITLDNSLKTILNATEKVVAWYDLLFLEKSYMRWAVYFLALIHKLNAKTIAAICKRLELSPKNRNLFGKERTQAKKCLTWLERNLPVQNSTLFKKLTGIKTELILYMMVATSNEVVTKAISRYMTQLRFVTISLGGKDLIAMGLASGPIYRQIFDKVRDAKLNGQLKTYEDEIKFVQTKFKAAIKSATNKSDGT